MESGTIQAQLPTDVARRLARLPRDLHDRYPHVPLPAIERDVEKRVHDLLGAARFNDFVPVLVYKAVLEDLRAT